MGFVGEDPLLTTRLASARIAPERHPTRESMMDDRDRDFFQQAEDASQSVLVTAGLLWIGVASIATAIVWRWFV